MAISTNWSLDVKSWHPEAPCANSTRGGEGGSKRSRLFYFSLALFFAITYAIKTNNVPPCLHALLILWTTAVVVRKDTDSTGLHLRDGCGLGTASEGLLPSSPCESPRCWDAVEIMDWVTALWSRVYHVHVSIMVLPFVWKTWTILIYGLSSAVVNGYHDFRFPVEGKPVANCVGNVKQISIRPVLQKLHK